MNRLMDAWLSSAVGPAGANRLPVVQTHFGMDARHSSKSAMGRELTVAYGVGNRRQSDMT